MLKHVTSERLLLPRRYPHIGRMVDLTGIEPAGGAPKRSAACLGTVRSGNDRA